MDAAVRQRDRDGQTLSSADQRATIFARSTGALPSAIAIVRISGPSAAKALRILTARPLPAERMAVTRHLRDGQGALLDTTLVLWLPGPRTVTGEDLVELHLHGGRAVVEAVEVELSKMESLRAAEPGEFTRRAFENGKIDLSQVEGLADLLSAETSRQRIAALTMVEGGLRRDVERWQSNLLALAARVEASIDHDDEPDVVAGYIDQDTRALVAMFDAALAQPPAERLRDGVRIGIAGPPNAGKSTLINALAGRDAAIVSPLAGTTRDLVEVPLMMGGIPVILIDMAGLREDSTDSIEIIGIDRAQEAIARSDLLLWLGLPERAPSESNILIVSPKCDVAPRGAGYAVSACTGEGMRALRAAIQTAAEALLPSLSSIALTVAQKAHIESARNALVESTDQLDDVLRAESLRYAMAALDRITGRADTEAMLDALFGRFCIGK